MNLRQAAQQALEAWFRPHGINYVDFKPYMEALRAALAEPQTTHWEGCNAVHPECKAKAELERKSDAIQRLWKERDELRALNAELVEALRCADAMLSGANMDAKAVKRKVRAALTKAGAKQ